MAEYEIIFIIQYNKRKTLNKNYQIICVYGTVSLFEISSLETL